MFKTSWKRGWKTSWNTSWKTSWNISWKRGWKTSWKIGWRNISRNKFYTAVNIFGLSLGICACLVIGLIIRYELSFDRFHPGKDRIYRVMGELTENSGEKLHFAGIPPAVVSTARTTLSGWEAITSYIPYPAKITIPATTTTFPAITAPAKNGAPRLFESRVTGSHPITTVLAEPEYFSIFPSDWLAGNAATALQNPFTVVLTESRARQYFGAAPPDGFLGKQVIYEDSLAVTVSGIIKDREENTDLAFTDFIAESTIKSSFLKTQIATDSWAQKDMNAWTFIRLAPGAPPARLNTQLNALIHSHASPQLKLVLSLEPLSGLHFNGNVVENPIRTADMPTLYGLMGIACFILLLAIINFINLSTAQSIRRAKEVGIRKVLGSSRTRLGFQFLTETAVLTLLSTGLALAAVKPVFFLFRSFLPEGMSFHFFTPSTIGILSLIACVTTVLAGWYPAKVLSSYSPVLSLKGGAEQKGGEVWLLRKGLIVFQFTVSLVFIIGAIVIEEQLRYARDTNPGFTADAILTIEGPRGDSLSKVKVLAQQLEQLPGISQTALQWVSPMTDNARGLRLKLHPADKKEIGATQVAGNENFIPLYRIQLLAGRNLAPSDSVREFVISETLSRQIGCTSPEQALGRTVYWRDRPYPVVGVVADFHTSSIHDPITPLCIINRTEREGAIAIKLSSTGNSSSATGNSSSSTRNSSSSTSNSSSSTRNSSASTSNSSSATGNSPNNIKTILVNIEKAWKKVYPDKTFNFRFYDESLALLYQKDKQTATLINLAMTITILISCIGLFGLALFTAEKKAKEISIRKILGASVESLTLLLCKDFLLLVTIAFLAAAPVAWYFMNRWLQNFAYHISIRPWVFLSAGAASLTIALLTVGYQTLKAARANPIKNLHL